MHETSAYTCWVESMVNLSVESLSRMLVPGDDADKFFIWDVSQGIPDFDLAHHREIYLEALELHSMAV